MVIERRTLLKPATGWPSRAEAASRSTPWPNNIIGYASAVINIWDEQKKTRTLTMGVNCPGFYIALKSLVLFSE